MTKPLQIVACAHGWPEQSYLIRGMNALIDSLGNYGYELTTLGWGQKWTGLGGKPKLLKKALENGTVKSDNIMFVDAFDVFFSDSPEAVLESFLAWDGSPSVIFNAEMSAFPDASLAKDHPKTDSPFKYLNSGMSIGSSEAYLQILTEMEVDKIPEDHRAKNGKMVEPNDQDHFMRKFLFGQCADHEVKIVLDSGCEIFQTMTGTKADDFDLYPLDHDSRGLRGTIQNKITKTFPSCWHFNGPSKTAGLMELFLEHFGL